MQWLQDPNQTKVDNLNTARCEAVRHSRNKKTKYLKAKINKLELENKNIRLAQAHQ
jgi:hypothetical protein